MEKKYLVLGATGSLGFAFTNELLSHGITTTILVRDRKKAKILFRNNKLLTILEGDVNDPECIHTASVDMDVIFHGINYPYQSWLEFMPPITAKVISAAVENNATILFPGNIYAYGRVPEKITEKSIPDPTTKKGRIRLDINNMLKNAARQNGCRVILLRLPDFFGENVTNGLIQPVFGNAVNNKPVTWLINADIPHQFVYTKDAARLFLMLSKETNLPEYFELNYGGAIVPSVRQWSKLISQISGSPKKVNVIPKVVLNILGWFNPAVRELKENYYQFENTIVLDDGLMKNLYPEFKETSMENAVRATVEWFKQISV
jgi:nucleoside-diphosphate-sugar epimerase